MPATCSTARTTASGSSTTSRPRTCGSSDPGARAAGRSPCALSWLCCPGRSPATGHRAAARPDTYQSLLASFGTAVPRRGEATWRRDEGGWSIPYRYQKRLNKWIARTFEPAAVTWVQEPRQSEAGSRADDEVPRHDTAV